MFVVNFPSAIWGHWKVVHCVIRHIAAVEPSSPDQTRREHGSVPSHGTVLPLAIATPSDAPAAARSAAQQCSPLRPERAGQYWRQPARARSRAPLAPSRAALHHRGHALQGSTTAPRTRRACRGRNPYRPGGPGPENLVSATARYSRTWPGPPRLGTARPARCCGPSVSALAGPSRRQSRSEVDSELPRARTSRSALPPSRPIPTRPQPARPSQPGRDRPGTARPGPARPDPNQPKTSLPNPAPPDQV